MLKNISRKRAHEIKKTIHKVYKYLSQEQGKHQTTDIDLWCVVKRLYKKDLKIIEQHKESFKGVPSLDHFHGLVVSELFEIAISKKRGSNETK